MGVLVATLLRDAPAGTPLRLRQTAQWDMWGSVRRAWARPGVRLGFWCHFTVQFSGMLFVLIWGYPFLAQGQGLDAGTAGSLLASMVPTGILIGLALGRLSAISPHRRLQLVSACLALTIGMWSVVLAWPGRAPLWLLVLLVLVLASNVPASMVGLDITRSNSPGDLGVATGLTNAGGFVAALIAIFLIGTILDLASAGSGATIGDYQIAMAAQYVVWLAGLFLLMRARMAVRRASPSSMD